jgi:uncharacterized protein
VNNKDLYVLGQSLGGMVTGEVAHEYPDLAGVILESTFPNFQKAAKQLIPQAFFGLPWWALPLHEQALSDYNLEAHLPAIQSPTLIIHGESDAMANFNTMEAAATKAQAENNHITFIPIRAEKVKGVTPENVREDEPFLMKQENGHNLSNDHTMGHLLTFIQKKHSLE